MSFFKWLLQRNAKSVELHPVLLLAWKQRLSILDEAKNLRLKSQKITDDVQCITECNPSIHGTTNRVRTQELTLLYCMRSIWATEAALYNEHANGVQNSAEYVWVKAVTEVYNDMKYVIMENGSCRLDNGEIYSHTIPFDDITPVSVVLTCNDGALNKITIEPI